MPVALLIAAVAAQSAPGIRPFQPAVILARDDARGLLTVAAPPTPSSAVPPALAVVADGRPVSWARPVVVGAAEWQYQLAAPVLGEADVRELSGWFVDSAGLDAQVDAWPAGAAPHARLESLTPGARGVWLEITPGWNVRRGDSWFVRRGRRPVARLDVTHVADDRAFCRVVPLAAAPDLAAGQRAAAWPSPSDRRHGIARSSVVGVRRIEDVQVAQIPAPCGVECPAEARVEVYRDGTFVADGVVESADARFWQVRISESAEHNAVQADDEVLARSRRQVEQRAFSARVLEVRPRSFLINAGEIDDVRPGEVVWLLRPGETPRDVRIARVQRDYAEAQFAQAADIVPRPGDEVRFAPTRGSPRTVARIESIAQETLLGVEWTAPDVTPDDAALAIVDRGVVVGVARVAASRGDRAIAVAVEPSLACRLERGMTLRRDAGAAE
ncbi:MAG: hypothetical protein CHACPFDD_01657 [Phycisphaerae bacterium]|nr:hypothetical protein [Phycisphaerae bacterium]